MRPGKLKARHPEEVERACEEAEPAELEGLFVVLQETGPWVERMRLVDVRGGVSCPHLVHDSTCSRLQIDIEISY